MNDIKMLRTEIDDINKKILELFNRRMEISAEIARYKESNKLPIFDSGREKEIITKVLKEADKKFPFETVEMYKTLMDISKNYQYRIINNRHKEVFSYKTVDDITSNTVIYQGIKGSYSFEALSKLFPCSKKLHADTFEEVLICLVNGEADLAVLPIENSSTGRIDVYDLISKYKCNIIAQTQLKISHNLLAVEGATIDSIVEIYSHPQAFLQCSEYLRKISKHTIPYFNTAISAKKVADLQDKTKAAIGSTASAKYYSLKILKENINDNESNYTRFAVITKDKILYKNASKISIRFSLKHEPGSLECILKIFMFTAINLLKIESSPSKTPWEYIFQIEIEGNIQEENISYALECVKNNTNNFEILGNYISL